MGYLWDCFLDLSASRQSGGFGVSPIAFEALMAYNQLMAVDFQPWEVEVIRALDRVWLKVRSES